MKSPIDLSLLRQAVMVVAVSEEGATLRSALLDPEGNEVIVCPDTLVPPGYALVPPLVGMFEDVIRHMIALREKIAETNTPPAGLH